MVRAANNKPINDAFSRFAKKRLNQKDWLSQRNYFRNDTTRRIGRLTLADLNAKKAKIQEYIAASVIIHSSDAWNYLSRSVESLINGDIASSIHLAYYAELRSVMSLLAFHGIGVFDRKHIWFDINSTPKFLTGTTTHNLACDGIVEWSKQKTKKVDLFQFLRVNNRNLADWIRESGGSSTTGYGASVINHWLTMWSVDLKLHSDQTLRNEMSYRPHFKVAVSDQKKVIRDLSEIWELLEPTSSGRFLNLDRYLLRFSLEDIFRKTRSKEPRGDEYIRFLHGMFNRLGENISQPLFDFLARNAQPADHLIFTEAKKLKKFNVHQIESSLPIICRAVLLLRLCTGASERMIINANLTSDDLRFWWESNCLQFGSIDKLDAGIDAIDLYTDIRDSIDELNQLDDASLSNVKSSFTFAPNSLFYIKQFNRAAVWGIGL